MFMILNCNNNLVRKSVSSSVHRFNLAGGLITLVERRSVVSLVTGPGVVAGLGAREVGVACSLVGVFSLDSALGGVVLVPDCGASGGSAVSSWLPFCNVMVSPVGRMWRRLHWRTICYSNQTLANRANCSKRTGRIQECAMVSEEHHGA